jgi:hypothetical protein
LTSTPPPPPTIDPNLLFDVNFDSSLDVDYTIDGNPLVFEPSNASAVTADDEFVTIDGGANYIKLTTGLPTYLKNTGDQSWIVNFRAESTSNNRLFLQTTPVDQGFEISVNQRTGLAIAIYNQSLQLTLYKGFRDILVNIFVNIDEIDLNANENSIVFTYERLNHRISLYFNGLFKSSAVAPASYVDWVINWSTSDNLYVNRFYTYSPSNPTHFHKISIYDKVLTLEEVEDIYDESQL